MPTGPKHYKLTAANDATESEWAEECRCMIGADHHDGDDGPASEYLSRDDATDIWLSSGQDEDYDFR
ncbi:hypothetical protein ACLBWJ_12985 [Microbacterium sp. M4A5_1d]